jgi:hypothetical protein
VRQVTPRTKTEPWWAERPIHWSRIFGRPQQRALTEVRIDLETHDLPDIVYGIAAWRDGDESIGRIGAEVLRHAAGHDKCVNEPV